MRFWATLLAALLLATGLALPAAMAQADTTPPEVRILRPVEDAIFDGPTRKVVPVFVAHDNTEVVAVTYTIRHVDTGEYLYQTSNGGTAYRPEPYAFDTTREADTDRFVVDPISPRRLRNGDVEITAEATDAAGNSASASHSFVVAIDVEAPTIELVEGTPENGEVVASGPVQLAFRITDDRPILRVAVFGTRTQILDLQPDADGIYRYTADFEPGKHQIQVVARDGANGTRKIFDFIALPNGADTDAPSVSLFTNVNSDDQLRFRVVATDVALKRTFYFIQNLDTGQYVQPKNRSNRFSEELADGFTRLSDAATGIAGDTRCTQWISLPPGNYRAVAFATDLAGNEADKIIRTFVIPG